MLSNIALIDGQNLIQNMKNAEDPWKIDLKKFRVFLKEKFNVNQALYFIGVKEERCAALYQFLEHSGYKVVFREHDARLKGVKKTNVDTDVMYEMMKHAYRDCDCDKIVLVSNDGDYKKAVSCLIADNKFRAIMFPGKNSSSLYRKIGDRFVIKLYSMENRKILELK